MADSRIKHEMYCVAGGPRKASYRKTSYTPTTYITIAMKAQGIRVLRTQYYSQYSRLLLHKYEMNHCSSVAL